jgi:hypothetical protein
MMRVKKRTRVEEERSDIHIHRSIVDHAIVSPIDNCSDLRLYIVQDLDLVLAEELFELGHNGHPKEKDICGCGVRGLKALY